MPYKIGIIGSGNIGGGLGKHFAQAGHSVMFSSRHPQELQSLAEEAGPNAQVGTVEEAAEFGEVLLLAYPFGKTPEVSKQVANPAGKVLIDANNYYPSRDGEQPGQEMQEKGLLESEWTASYYLGAHVAKAFNSIHAKTLADRAFEKGGYLWRFRSARRMRKPGKCWKRFWRVSGLWGCTSATCPKPKSPNPTKSCTASRPRQKKSKN